MASFVDIPSFFFLLLLLLLCFYPCSSTKHAGCFSKIYSFGDSLTDTGNTHSSEELMAFSHVSEPPYGMTYFHRPTNRFSDGRLVIDFLAQTLGFPLLPPYRDSTADFSHGVNFAVAGGTAIDDEFYVLNRIFNKITFNNALESLQTQLDWFTEFVEGVECKGISLNECKKKMKNALFWVGEIGANDYTRIYGSSFRPDRVRDMAVANTIKFLRAVVGKGAKYIIVQGMPPTGCMAATMAMNKFMPKDDSGCIAGSNQNAALHNKLLLEKLNQFRQQNPGVVVLYADFFNAYLYVQKNARKYGFQEPFKTCCGYGGGLYNFDMKSTCGYPGATKPCTDPTKYINWDGVHLTEAMYSKLASLFFNQSYCQPSFDQLIKSKKCVH
ncbi:GDSL esterase/lipase [Cinnamomum micranthum f. kanehirae]|uniref:GDSL esterase/lipase n=1 Tax=Cinnamomum micranthum f. kanehirae TaxID=337451 RepID=A0A3S3ND26_9MAGN|nr:GDSL esterase/lipase [Cinnamomum micranthum f. kanehirae]